MTIAFHMDAATALEAWDLFTFYDADTEEKRIEVIKQMILRGYNISVFSTARTPQQIADDYAKHGSVLYLKGEDNGEERLQNKDYEFCPECERPYWDCSCNNDNTSST